MPPVISLSFCLFQQYLLGRADIGYLRFSSSRLGQELYALFCLVHPVLDQARGRNIAVLVTEMCAAKIVQKALVVFEKLGQHVLAPTLSLSLSDTR
jgi:hypothetical protein